MKFLTQTKFHDAEKGTKGNCMMACYASYFDMEIDQVPAIEELFDDPAGCWYLRLEEWLATKGLIDRSHYKNGQPVDPAASGYTDYYFATGPGPRGVYHMVIYQGGKMVHDPHPSRAGLLEVKSFTTLEKISS